MKWPEDADGRTLSIGNIVEGKGGRFELRRWRTNEEGTLLVMLKNSVGNPCEVVWKPESWHLATQAHDWMLHPMNGASSARLKELGIEGDARYHLTEPQRTRLEEERKRIEDDPERIKRIDEALALRGGVS